MRMIIPSSAIGAPPVHPLRGGTIGVTVATPRPRGSNVDLIPERRRVRADH